MPQCEAPREAPRHFRQRPPGARARRHCGCCGNRRREQRQVPGSAVSHGPRSHPQGHLRHGAEVPHRHRAACPVGDSEGQAVRVQQVLGLFQQGHAGRGHFRASRRAGESPSQRRDRLDSRVPHRGGPLLLGSRRRQFDLHPCQPAPRYTGPACRAGRICPDL